MSFHARRLSALPTNILAGAAVAALATGMLAAPAQAAAADHDGDGIPTRFERNHSMRPYFAGDARLDFDRDGLINRAEFRVRSSLRDEDTDNDGHDDGDEVRDGYRSTHVLDRNTDDDRQLDGDEDADGDDVDNEDEDDTRERCRFDDDDHDSDDVDTEDENELGLVAGDRDSDDDGLLDGDEDADEDGEANEDEDDLLGDNCSGDFDGDGEADEDEKDLLGSITSYTSHSTGGGTLVISTVAGHSFSGEVTAGTEIEFEESESEDESEDESDVEYDDEGSTADLKPGTQVAELELDDETLTIEEITLYRPLA